MKCKFGLEIYVNDFWWDSCTLRSDYHRRLQVTFLIDFRLQTKYNIILSIHKEQDYSMRKFQFKMILWQKSQITCVKTSHIGLANNVFILDRLQTNFSPTKPQRIRTILVSTRSHINLEHHPTLKSAVQPKHSHVRLRNRNTLRVNTTLDHFTFRPQYLPNL